MIIQEEAQRILDRFHVGRIENFEDCGFFHKAKTKRGIFYILNDDPLEARETEKRRCQKLVNQVGKVERLLLPDLYGELREDVSYVHQKGVYYSVYKYWKSYGPGQIYPL